MQEFEAMLQDMGQQRVADAGEQQAAMYFKLCKICRDLKAKLDGQTIDAPNPYSAHVWHLVLVHNDHRDPYLFFVCGKTGCSGYLYKPTEEDFLAAQATDYGKVWIYQPDRIEVAS